MKTRKNSFGWFSRFSRQKLPSLSRKRSISSREKLFRNKNLV